MGRVWREPQVSLGHLLIRSGHFLPKDAPERFFELWSSAFDMLAQGIVDKMFGNRLNHGSLSLFRK